VVDIEVLIRTMDIEEKVITILGILKLKIRKVPEVQVEVEHIRDQIQVLVEVEVDMVQQDKLETDIMEMVEMVVQQ